MASEINNESAGEQKTEQATFDTTGMLLECLSRWKWFVFSVVVCLAGAWFIMARMVPKYQVTASIYLNEDAVKGNNSLNLSAEIPLMMMNDYIDASHLELIKSQNNLIGIVDSLGLMYSYAQKGVLRPIPLYCNNTVGVRLDSVSLRNLKTPIKVEIKRLQSDIDDSTETYDIEVKSRYVDVEEEFTYTDVTLPLTVELAVGTLEIYREPLREPMVGTELATVVSPRMAARALSGQITVEYAEDSNSIMRISVTTPVVDQGIDVVNAMLASYNQQIIDDKNRSAMQTEEHILDRLVSLNDELQDVEQRLQDYRQRHNVTDLHLQASLNLSQKNTVEVDLANIQAQQQAVDEIARAVSNADTYQALPSVTDHPTLSQVIESYNKKVAQYNRLLQQSTPDNPLARSMRDDLNRDKMRILQNIQSVQVSLQSRRNSVAAIDRVNNSELAQLPPVDKGMQEIFREQQVKVNIYTFLLQRREEIALQKTMATGPARLIDDPMAEAPVSPRRETTYILALLLGLAIPAGVIYLRRTLFPVLHDQSELERLTTIPMLGELCKVSTADGQIVVAADRDTPVAELFRLLRNNISFVSDGGRRRVILVTSAVPGEGKSFVSANLAAAIALTGKSTVLVGTDLRNPVLARSFGLDNHSGVSTYLSGLTTDVNALLQHTDSMPKTLDVLVAGPVPPNPNELLLSERMRELIEKLRNEYDVVVIDTAPIGIISDTLLLAQLSDIQILVARAGVSTSRGLQILNQAVASGRFQRAYIVLNGVDIESNSYLYRRFGHYGNYGHHAYRYGYNNRRPKGIKRFLQRRKV